MQRVAKSVLLMGSYRGKESVSSYTDRKTSIVFQFIVSIAIEAVSGCFHTVLGRKVQRSPGFWNVLSGLGFISRAFVCFVSLPPPPPPPFLRPLTEEEIVDLQERHYDSIAEKQKDVDRKLQREVSAVPWLIEYT